MRADRYGRLCRGRIHRGGSHNLRVPGRCSGIHRADNPAHRGRRRPAARRGGDRPRPPWEGVPIFLAFRLLHPPPAEVGTHSRIRPSPQSRAIATGTPSCCGGTDLIRNGRLVVYIALDVDVRPKVTVSRQVTAFIPLFKAPIPILELAHLESPFSPSANRICQRLTRTVCPVRIDGWQDSGGGREDLPAAGHPQA